MVYYLCGKLVLGEMRWKLTAPRLLLRFGSLAFRALSPGKMMMEQAVEAPGGRYIGVGVRPCCKGY